MALKLSSKRQKRRRRVLATLGILFSLGLVAVLLYVPIFQIKGIEIQGAKHTGVAALQASIVPFIDGYRYGFIPNENIFLYERKKIKDFVMREYPSVESIDIRVDTSRTLIVHIKDRKPLGVWCSDQCYLYDTAGVLFKKSFTYTGALYVSWKRDGLKPLTLLDTVECVGLCTDVKFLEFLRSYRIEKAVIHDSTVDLWSTDGYYIKSGLIASTTMSHMKDVMDSRPGLLQSLEYIDLRFENKIFYRERGGGTSVDIE